MTKSKKHISEITKFGLLTFFLNLYFYSPVSVYLYTQRGLNYFQILLLESILALFILTFEVPTGILADKFGRKISVIASTFLTLVSVVILYFANSYTMFIVSFAIGGIAITFYSGTVEAMLYDELKESGKESEMHKAMGSLKAYRIAASMVAPAVGSIIAKDLLPSQIQLLILLTAVSMFIAFVISLLLKDTKEKGVKEDNPIDILKSGIHELNTNKNLTKIALLGVFTSPFSIVFVYLYQPYFKKAGINTAIWGTIVAVGTLASIVSSKYAYKLDEIFKAKTTLIISVIIPGIIYILMGILAGPFMAIILFILYKTSTSFRVPILSKYRNKYIKSNNRATIISLISMLSGIYAMINRPIIGKIADYNLNYAFLIMGAIIVMASLVFGVSEDVEW